MPQAETRRLAAIMFTDIVGFSHQMGANEARMLRLLAAHNHILWFDLEGGLAWMCPGALVARPSWPRC
jgi:hypothetical protein